MPPTPTPITELCETGCITRRLPNLIFQGDLLLYLSRKTKQRGRNTHWRWVLINIWTRYSLFGVFLDSFNCVSWIRYHSTTSKVKLVIPLRNSLNRLQMFMHNLYVDFSDYLQVMKKRTEPSYRKSVFLYPFLFWSRKVLLELWFPPLSLKTFAWEQMGGNMQNITKTK